MLESWGTVDSHLALGFYGAMLTGFSLVIFLIGVIGDIREWRASAVTFATIGLALAIFGLYVPVAVAAWIVFRAIRWLLTRAWTK